MVETGKVSTPRRQYDQIENAVNRPTYSIQEAERALRGRRKLLFALLKWPNMALARWCSACFDGHRQAPTAELKLSVWVHWVIMLRILNDPNRKAALAFLQTWVSSDRQQLCRRSRQLQEALERMSAALQAHFKTTEVRCQQTA